MKFNVASKQLYNQVAAVSRVISSKNAMTILNNFLFVLKGDELTITASDIENTLTAKIEVTEVEGEGVFCADARKIVELLKELPDQGITFEINETNFAISITYFNGDFSLIGINGAEYPSDREVVDESQCLELEIPAAEIIDGIENTLFAVGSDEIWPQMMGILWDMRPENMTFVATDSRKLVKYLNGNIKPGVEGSFILPVKPASILKNILVKNEESVKIRVEPKSATFTFGNYVFNCRFIKGQFPDYNRVIPKNNPYSLTVDRLSFLNSVKRVAIFVEQGHGLVKFKLEPEKITMKAQDNTLCTSGTETLSGSFDGSPMVIGFSSNYLIEIFSTLKSKDVILKLSDPSRPGLFLPDENEEGNELLMLLMPMTVSEF